MISLRNRISPLRLGSRKTQTGVARANGEQEAQARQEGVKTGSALPLKRFPLRACTGELGQAELAVLFVGVEILELKDAELVELIAHARRKESESLQVGHDARE